MVPLAAEGVTFFACAKKVTKESTPQAARPALRSGSASGPGISVRHIPVPYGNAVIHDGALRVVPSPLAVPHGDPKASKSKAAASDVSGVALGPPEVRQSRRVKPRRGGAQDVRRFRRGQSLPRTRYGDAPHENSRRDCAPAARGGRTAGVCFLCLLSLHKQRK